MALEGSQNNAVVAQLDPFIKARAPQREWPGSKVGNEDSPIILLLGFSHTLASLILALNADLFAWQQYEFPEDLCLYRADGTTWLGSIAHEHDAFLALDEEELAAVRAAIPNLRLEPDPPEASDDLATRNWLEGLI